MTAADKTYSSAIVEASNYTRWVVDEFRPFIGRRLLEVGLGHGSYREQLPPLEHYVGLDIDEEAVAAAEARAGGSGDLYLAADITEEALVERLRAQAVDTVLCVNVLEHIEDDRRALANLLAALPSGGRLLLFVPAFQALYNDLDRFAGHHRRYRKASLGALVPQAQARILRMRYFNAIGALGWWVNSLARHDSLDDPGVNSQIALFDRYVLPLSRAINPLTGPFLGLSLTMVAEKR